MKSQATQHAFLVFLATQATTHVAANREPSRMKKHMLLAGKRSNSCAGFTLIELLLYVGIASMILLMTSLFLSTLLQSRVKNQTIAEVEQQGLQVMQIITQTIRNAEAINSPAVGASAADLELNVVTGTSDPTIFALSSDVIQITEGAGLAVSLTNNRVAASGLNFQNMSRSATPGTVRVEFTITHVNPEGRNEYDFSKTFYGSASLRQP